MIYNTTSNDSNLTIESEIEYPCHCGEIHIGEYGLYRYLQHNCLHREPLFRLMEEDTRYLICVSCGQTFFSISEYNTTYKTLDEYLENKKKTCKHELILIEDRPICCYCSTYIEVEVKEIANLSS